MEKVEKDYLAESISNKVPFARLRKFLDDPAKIKENQHLQDTEFYKKYFLPTYNAITILLQSKVEPIVIKQKEDIVKVRRKYSTEMHEFITVDQRNKEQVALQYTYKTGKYATVEKEIKAINEKAEKEYQEVLHSEISLELFLCPQEKMPSFKLLSSSDYAPYLGICIMGNGTIGKLS